MMSYASFPQSSVSMETSEIDFVESFGFCGRLWTERTFGVSQEVSIEINQLTGYSFISNV